MCHDYNRAMIGVDLADQKLTNYEIYPHRVRRWPLREFHNFLDMAVHNAFVLYQQYPENRLTAK